MESLSYKKYHPRWGILPFLVGFGTSESISHSLTIRSSHLEFFKIKVPTHGKILIQSSSPEPVVLLASYKYLPTEEHYDVASVESWLRQERRAELLLPLDKMREHPCSPLEAMRECLNVMNDGLLTCGEASSPYENLRRRLYEGDGIHKEDESKKINAEIVQVEDDFDDESEPTLETDDDDKPTCHTYVGDCNGGQCEVDRGPTVCNVTSIGTGLGQCICQPGYCEIAGRCVLSGLLQKGCYKITGHTCPFLTCPTAMGPANCEDALCVCPKGYCAEGGMCMPGPLCEEFGMQAMCEASDFYEMGSSIRSPNDAVRRLAAESKDCCRIVDTARRRDPGSFARCTARHFFSFRDINQISNGAINIPELDIGTDNGEWVGIGLKSDSSNDVPVQLQIMVQDGTPKPYDWYNTIGNHVTPASKVDPTMHRFMLNDQDPYPVPFTIQAGEPTLFYIPSHPSKERQSEGYTYIGISMSGPDDAPFVFFSQRWPEPKTLLDFGNASKNVNLWTAPTATPQYFLVLVSESGTYYVRASRGRHMVPKELDFDDLNDINSLMLSLTPVVFTSVMLLVLVTFGVSWREKKVEHQVDNCDSEPDSPKFEQNILNPHFLMADCNRSTTMGQNIISRSLAKLSTFTDRLATVSTRCSTTDRRALERNYLDDVSEMNAVMKLRPAMEDSLGDDADLELPLMGNDDRATLLHR